MEEEVKAVDVKDIAAEEMGKKLLESLIGVVQSIKRPWAEMTQYEQDDAIERCDTTSRWPRFRPCV